MKRIAIFASGNGSNAQAIIRYFQEHPSIKIDLVLCNNLKAKVIDVAALHHIQLSMITRSDLYETDHVIGLLNEKQIDLIVLAGFLWRIPETLLNAFPKRIINIHPALLPLHGGAGMYGMRVHEAVHASKEKETGISIHYLNEQFDEGEIIFQKSVPIAESDTPDIIAENVQKLEHRWYPEIIEQLLSRPI